MVGMPQFKIRSKQKNDFLKTVLKSELDKLSQYNNRKQGFKPGQRCISRKNTLADDKESNENHQNPMQIDDINAVKFNEISPIVNKVKEGKLFIKVSNFKCIEKPESTGSRDISEATTKRSTSNTRKTPVEPPNIDSPSFVKL